MGHPNRSSAFYIVSSVGTSLTMLAIDPHVCWRHWDPQCYLQCLPETLLSTDLWDSGLVHIDLKIKDGGDSHSLSESEFDYGVDGYLCEPTRSNDDTTGHVNCVGNDSDSETAGVVVAYTLTHQSILTGFGRVGSIGFSTCRGTHDGCAPVTSVPCCCTLNTPEIFRIYSAGIKGK